MYVIQIFLPLYDNEGSPFAKPVFESVRSELADRFGGVTAFVRAPAVGIWKDDDGSTHRDELAVFEVMADHVDAAWWKAYRSALEHTFRQDEILVRSMASHRL